MKLKIVQPNLIHDFQNKKTQTQQARNLTAYGHYQIWKACMSSEQSLEGRICIHSSLHLTAHMQKYVVCCFNIEDGSGLVCCGSYLVLCEACDVFVNLKATWANSTCFIYSYISWTKEPQKLKYVNLEIL